MNSREEIFNTISAILVNDFEVDDGDLSLDSNLYSDLDLDSIDAVDLVVKLNDITGEKLEPQAFKQVRTVADVVNELERLVVVS